MAKQKSDEDLKPCSVRLPSQLREELDAHCRREDLTATQVIRRALREYLQRHGEDV